jgi:hypothetical protein
MRVKMDAVDAEVREVVYERPSDTLQIWLIDGPAPLSINHHLTDGLYVILDAETDSILGYEVMNLKTFADHHDGVHDLLRRLRELGSGSVILRDVARSRMEPILQYA